MSSRVLDFEKYTAKARQAVAEGQVLLLNQNHVLPLPKGSHVAVVRPAAHVSNGLKSRIRPVVGRI